VDALSALDCNFAVDRTMIAMAGLKKFEQHSYPDVLLSVLIKKIIRV
jgi:hypothetical protein